MIIGKIKEKRTWIWTGGAGLAQWWERSPPTNVSRVDSWTRCHMWVEFIVGSPLCSERFFSGYSGFPLSSKTNISKVHFDLAYCQALYHKPLARVIAQALTVFDIKFAFAFTFWRVNDWNKRIHGRKRLFDWVSTALCVLWLQFPVSLNNLIEHRINLNITIH